MTTRDKLAFALLLGRHSSASLADCQRLLRFAATLKRINGDDDQTARKIRLQRKVVALCATFDREVRFERSGAIRLDSAEHSIEVPA